MEWESANETGFKRGVILKHRLGYFRFEIPIRNASREAMQKVGLESGVQERGPGWKYKYRCYQPKDGIQSHQTELNFQKSRCGQKR